eukprot:scaffold412_cov388-Prasinococcus_capsulatus_cf.AAC.31
MGQLSHCARRSYTFHAALGGGEGAATLPVPQIRSSCPSPPQIFLFLLLHVLAGPRARLAPPPPPPPRLPAHAERSYAQPGRLSSAPGAHGSYSVTYPVVPLRRPREPIHRLTCRSTCTSTSPARRAARAIRGKRFYDPGEAVPAGPVMARHAQRAPRGPPPANAARRLSRALGWRHPCLVEGPRRVCEYSPFLLPSCRVGTWRPSWPPIHPPAMSTSSSSPFPSARTQRLCVASGESHRGV